MSFEYSIAYSLENLRDMRKALERYMSKSGIEQTIIEAIILGIDEVCTNAIQHGHSNKFAQKLHIRIIEKPDGLVIDIWDIGGQPPAIPSEQEIQDRLKANEPNGYGLYLLHANIDKVEFISRENTFQCRMFKAFK